MKKVFWFILFLAFLSFWGSTPLFSRNFSSQKFEDVSSQRLFNNDVERQQRVQRRWNGNFCITNWGVFGSMTRDYYESVGCLFCDHPDNEYYPAESFEFPSGSGLEYLFWGSIWIGGIVNEETLVTVGCDGWWWIHEMAPEAGAGGNITESDGPLGDQECIAVYYDTAVPPPLTWFPVPMDWDNREHIPLGLKIAQHSYSWETPPYDNFVILEFWLKNIGTDSIYQSYIGFYMDTDIMHIDENPYAPEQGYQDDITGFLKEYETSPGETTEVEIFWAADNDGQPHGGVFTEKSPTGVIGFKLLDCSNPNPEISFNWWVSHTEGYPKDWGPWLASNQSRWDSINPYGTDGYFPGWSPSNPCSALGTPGGDRSKYFILSNGEIDYDQIFSAEDHTAEGWLPPSPYGNNLADGFDTRFLFSFGPFDISPGDSIFAVIAVVAGDSFHIDPNNRPNLPGNPDKYYQNLNFSDLVKNALKAKEVYQSGYTLPPPGPPRNLNGIAISDSTIFLSWSPKIYHDLKGYNIYRSTSPNDTTSTPINLTPIEDTTFLDDDVLPKITYYYSVTSVDSNENEGNRCDEIDVLAGRPFTPVGLKAEAQKDIVDLTWNSNTDPDLACYKIYRVEFYDTLFQLLDSVQTDTTYIDNSVVNGIIYHYRITALDTMGLESFPTDTVYALPMAFDQGIGLIDRTVDSSSGYFTYQNIGDSVNAFYKRALHPSHLGYKYDYTYLERSNPYSDSFRLSLQDLSPFPIIILHGENLKVPYGDDSTMTILQHYLHAGGKLIFEGRNNLGFLFANGALGNTLFFCGHDYSWWPHSAFPCDYLHLEQAFLPNYHFVYPGVGVGSEEFIGAKSQVFGYPSLEVDSVRIASNWHEIIEDIPDEGRLPGVGYIIAKDGYTWPIDIIYTFDSYYDTSDLEEKPVAIRYLGTDYQFVFFDFPLYFIKEEQAIQVLHKALDDLGVEYVYVEEGKEEESPPDRMVLNQNYPNPFNLTTTIPFYTSCKGQEARGKSPTHTTLIIYNILGQKVKTLVDKPKEPGKYTVIWDGKDDSGKEVSSGIYFFRLKVGEYSEVKKMLLLK